MLDRLRFPRGLLRYVITYSDVDEEKEIRQYGGKYLFHDKN